MSLTKAPNDAHNEVLNDAHNEALNEALNDAHNEALNDAHSKALYDAHNEAPIDAHNEALRISLRMFFDCKITIYFDNTQIFSYIISNISHNLLTICP